MPTIESLVGQKIRVVVMTGGEKLASIALLGVLIKTTDGYGINVPSGFYCFFKPENIDTILTDDGYYGNTHKVFIR